MGNTELWLLATSWGSVLWPATWRKQVGAGASLVILRHLQETAGVHDGRRRVRESESGRRGDLVAKPEQPFRSRMPTRHNPEPAQTAGVYLVLYKTITELVAQQAAKD